MPPIDDALQHDAVQTLSRTLTLRRNAGVEDGTRPTDWSDDAQTVGWCRDLMGRWPEGKRRMQMALMLAQVGYPDYLPQ